MLKYYLSLMNEFYNDKLVLAFQNILVIFGDEIKRYAVQLCIYLTKQYFSCIKKGSENDAPISAHASFTLILKLVELNQQDAPLLAELEVMMFPCLLHSLTTDGMNLVKTAINCITLILRNGNKAQPVTNSMWTIYPWFCY